MLKAISLCRARLQKSKSLGPFLVVHRQCLANFYDFFREFNMGWFFTASCPGMRIFGKLQLAHSIVAKSEEGGDSEVTYGESVQAYLSRSKT